MNTLFALLFHQDPYEKTGLIDGGTGSVNLIIFEKDLLSHVILFSSKEYKGLKYVDGDTDIFAQRSRKP